MQAGTEYPEKTTSPPIKPNSVGFISNPHREIAHEFGVH